jgi:hypothetical protein
MSYSLRSRAAVTNLSISRRMSAATAAAGGTGGFII